MKNYIFRHILATIRVLVDGGANRWFQYIDENGLSGVLKEPCFVCGDMDSISEASIKRLTEMNIELKRTPDQDETDLTKAVMISKPPMEELGVSGRKYVSTCKKNVSNKKILYNYCFLQMVKVLILTDHSGRIDHLMAQINSLHKIHWGELFLLTHDSLAWLLRPGVHRLTIPIEFVETQVWCSYIPVGSACKVTTRGLKYDLSK